MYSISGITKEKFVLDNQTKGKFTSHNSEYMRRLRLRHISAAQKRHIFAEH